jgi:hypothetical protein
MDERPGYATGQLLIHDGQVAMLGRAAPAAKHLVWPDLAGDCGCERHAQFPPVALPEAVDLARMVATDGVGWLRRLAALAKWVGEGKTVDGRREPRKADVPVLLASLDLPASSDRTGGTPALTRMWRLAIEFDVIQRRRTRVVAGSGTSLIANTLAGAAEPEQVLDFWSDLADELLDPPAPATTAPRNGEHLTGLPAPLCSGSATRVGDRTATPGSATGRRLLPPLTRHGYGAESNPGTWRAPTPAYPADPGEPPRRWPILAVGLPQADGPVRRRELGRVGRPGIFMPGPSSVTARVSR